ncbi:hypothetical protein PsYK624_115970 [Phanerochaete sordida]|uniref:Uncharacterized protein n=1 Tax=Phanerochaete sordida TaxID=48140 RepID=A0A9P3LHV7_9APHY|nr:hypothetical protein PsYK624_115970 [Phanerochaete sordida]
MSADAVYRCTLRCVSESRSKDLTNIGRTTLQVCAQGERKTEQPALRDTRYVRPKHLDEVVALRRHQTREHETVVVTGRVRDICYHVQDDVKRRRGAKIQNPSVYQSDTRLLPRDSEASRRYMGSKIFLSVL